MLIIDSKDCENIDKALKKYKKKFEKSKTLLQLRERQAFTKPSVVRRGQVLKAIALYRARGRAVLAELGLRRRLEAPPAGLGIGGVHGGVRSLLVHDPSKRGARRCGRALRMSGRTDEASRFRTRPRGARLPSRCEGR